MADDAAYLLFRDKTVFSPRKPNCSLIPHSAKAALCPREERALKYMLHEQYSY